MSEGLGWLIAAVLLGASILVAWLFLLVRVVRSDLEPKWKWAALVPVITPVSAWRADHRKAVIVWGALLVAYVLVRILW